MAQRQLTPQEQSRTNDGQAVVNPDGSLWRRGVLVSAGDAARSAKTRAQNEVYAAQGGQTPDRTRDHRAEGEMAQARYEANPVKFVAEGWDGQPLAPVQQKPNSQDRGQTAVEDWISPVKRPAPEAKGPAMADMTSPTSGMRVDMLPTMQLAADGGYILPPNTVVPPNYEWLAQPALTPAQKNAMLVNSTVARIMGREPAQPTSGGTITRNGKVTTVPPSFAGGGYTGPGDKLQPAGIVHAGEFVIPKEKVEEIGVPALDAYFETDSTKPKYGFVEGGAPVAADFIPPEAYAAIRALRAAGAPPSLIQNAVTNRRWKDLAILANETAGFQRRSEVSKQLEKSTQAFDSANRELATIATKARPKVEEALIASLSAMPPEEVYNLTTVKDPYSGAILREGIRLDVPANDSPKAAEIAAKTNAARLRQAAALAMSAPRDSSAAPSPLGALYKRAEDIGTQEFRAEIGAAKNKAEAAQKERDIYTALAAKEGAPGANPLAPVSAAEDRDAKYQAEMSRRKIATGGETFDQMLARETKLNEEYLRGKSAMAKAVATRDASLPSVGASYVGGPGAYFSPDFPGRKFSSLEELSAATTIPQSRIDALNQALGGPETPPLKSTPMAVPEFYAPQESPIMPAGPADVGSAAGRGFGMGPYENPVMPAPEFYAPQESPIMSAQEFSAQQGRPEAFPKTQIPPELLAERVRKQQEGRKFREGIASGVSAIFGQYTPTPEEIQRAAERKIPTIR